MTISTRLVLRYGVRWMRGVFWLVALALGGGLTSLRFGFGHDGGAFDQTGAIVGAALGVVIWLGLMVADALERPGVRVREAEQPELDGLVRDAAARAGVRPPDRIWLTYEASVEAQVRLWRRELLIGQPLVVCLPEPELRSLIARRLALLAYPRARLIIRLVARWSDAAALVAGGEEHQRWRRREARLREVGMTASAAGDAAAIAAAGTATTAASAVVAALSVVTRYQAFVDATTVPSRSWQNERLFEDLDEAWLVTAVRGWSFRLIDDDPEHDILEMHAAEHPTLSYWLRDLRGARVSYGAQPRQPLQPLSPRHRRRLVRRLRDKATLLYINWITFATAPANWWSDRARTEADDIRGDVTKLLGREPVDDFEAADVLLNRNDDILVLNGVTPTDGVAPPETWEPPAILSGLVENGLLAQGWYLEHPAVRGVLIGPSGQRLDVVKAVTPDPPGWNLDGLRAVLRPAAVEVDHS